MKLPILVCSFSQVTTSVEYETHLWKLTQLLKLLFIPWHIWFFFSRIWFINNGLIQVFSAINPHYITWNYISYGRCSEASFTVPLLNVTKKYIVIFKGTSFNRLFTFSCSQKNARKYSSSFKKYSMRSLEPNCTNIQQLSIQKLKPETVFH